MKYMFLMITFLILASVDSNAQKSEHVVIITIDGFRPDFYMDSSWGMVNLRQLQDQGVHAESVNGVFPTVTFVNHTTIITGEKSVDLGILYNAPYLPIMASFNWNTVDSYEEPYKARFTIT